MCSGVKRGVGGVDLARGAGFDQRIIIGKSREAQSDRVGAIDANTQRIIVGDRDADRRQAIDHMVLAIRLSADNGRACGPRDFVISRNAGCSSLSSCIR